MKGKTQVAMQYSPNIAMSLAEGDALADRLGCTVYNQSDDLERDHGGDGQLVLEREKLAVKPPPMYRVVMLDDDFTPMDFVVDALQQFFGFSREKATETMLKVHNQGYAVCGIFTKDVAETKAAQVLDYAREHQHPLFCRAEPQEE